MNIVIVGGKLQGVEVAYLAGKAGFRTLLIDRHRQVPAAGICDLFIQYEFSHENSAPKIDSPIDLIVPALENLKALKAIEKWARQKQIPLAFDLSAFMISKSKLKSDELFEQLNLPIPQPFPHCHFPIIVKPDEASGSKGVKIFETPFELAEAYPQIDELNSLVVQEFVPGASYSIEVIAMDKRHQALQVTDLFMDDIFDCCRVTAPTSLSKELTIQLKKMAEFIAQKIRLQSIMDLEVILHGGEIKILEIDARFPSQTPITVFWSSGINMVKLIAGVVSKKKSAPFSQKRQPVLLEHIRVNASQIEFAGEHIMGQDGMLQVRSGFFGAEEAITSYGHGKQSWVATLIFTGASFSEIKHKQKLCYDRIKEIQLNGEQP